METITLSHRRYLFWPSAQHGLAPAVVFLHGTGGAAEWVDSEVFLSSFAKEAGFTLAVPAGLPPKPSQPAAFLSNPQRWNDGSTTPNDPHHSTSDDLTFLDDVFTDLIKRGADPKRLYLAGFSNGAGMTFRYAASGRVPLAAITAVAGHCWIDPPVLKRPVPTLYMIGDRDPLIPLAGGEVRIPWGDQIVQRPPLSQTLSKWAVANQCDLHPTTRQAEHGIAVSQFHCPLPSMEFQAVVISGLGHHWPGGAGQLNPRLAGPKMSPISANVWMWNFFRKHSPG